MAKKRSSVLTREAILAAAANIVLERGASRMTLEAVAKKAGVSKGGLLYHFPSKEALIEGMIEHMNQEFTERIREEYENDDLGTNQGRWLRALIRATFASTHCELCTGLIAAVLLDPELLEPNRRSYAIRQNLIEQDGIDPVLATIIRFAVDGLWFSELLAFAPPTEAQRTRLKEALLALTTGEYNLQTDQDNDTVKGDTHD